MIKWHLILLFSFFSNSLLSQNFEPIPKENISDYTFNLKKNFYENEADINIATKEISTISKEIETYFANENITEKNWATVLDLYNSLEKKYRTLDLYYFLKYAINVSDNHSLEISDSLRNIILAIRNQLTDHVNALTKEKLDKLKRNLPNYEIFFNKTISQAKYKLSKPSRKLLEPFEYLEDNRFYDEAFNKMVFEKVETENGQIDVINQQSLWENHKDEKVRDKAEATLLAGYETQKNYLGYNYINYIKGLNAFSIAEGHQNFLDEKLSEFELDSNSLKNYFNIISANSKERQIVESISTDTIRFDINKASQIIINALSGIGNDYKMEVENILNPKNGRIDIVGGDNRIAIRGTASVYPIKTSIFYAQNYEGYLIDLTLLAHEIGHSVQASLMFKNNVLMTNATGPAYFTESFGKFNELILFDYLSKNEKDQQLKKLYNYQLVDRMNVIYGSTLEALIEYNLIEGIINSTLKTPEDLDNRTYELGVEFDNKRFEDRKYLKGFWMLLQTNFIAPLHNINDMLASILAVNYFKQYKSDKEKFLHRYNNLLKNGYTKSPKELLKEFDIDLNNKQLIQDTFTFIKNY